MKTDKQKAIEEAYGEYFDFVENYLDENGWAKYPNIQQHDVLGIELQFNDGCTLLRPKSLQGIETNNGWIKIESEDDLPKQKGMYYIFHKDFELETAEYDIEVERWYTTKESIRRFPSHYQPIQKPEPPIF